MDTALTVLSLVAFAVLTAGTALFVAAEFSLTTLERSTVEANARTGGRRDRHVRRAHQTLSFQLSGAQLGISITTLATGYLAEPVRARCAVHSSWAALSPVRSSVATGDHHGHPRGGGQAGHGIACGQRFRRRAAGFR